MKEILPYIAYILSRLAMLVFLTIYDKWLALTYASYVAYEVFTMVWDYYATQERVEELYTPIGFVSEPIPYEDEVDPNTDSNRLK